MTTKSREERILYLIRVARAILVRADALLQGETEYLRDELARLLENTDVLLEKMSFEEALLELRKELHVERLGGPGFGDEEVGGAGDSTFPDDPPVTGIRSTTTE